MRRSDFSMQPGVVCPEVVGKPRIQTLRQLDAVDILGQVEGIHDPAKVIQEAFVVALVRRELIVVQIPHELLLEGEVGRDALQ